jgi:transposase
MSRPRSAKTEEAKTRIRARLKEGAHRPGDKFLSARQVAAQFDVSYQTAHRLLVELTEEGTLERRAQSGTYVPGRKARLSDAQLFFDARARREGSFGARLLSDLTRRLERECIPYELRWTDKRRVEIYEESLPVLWEAPEIAARCARAHRMALLLNDRPQPGLGAAYLDSVSMDDFSGGAAAAQLLLRATPRHLSVPSRFCVLSGPTHDARSRARRGGFLSVAQNAPVVASRSWFFEDGYEVASEAVRLGENGIFCGNDRLAQAVAQFCADNALPCPRLIGFDNAPIAETLHLTTMAIPWEEMIAGAVEIIRRRLTGDTSAARQIIIAPRPVLRKI